MSEPITINKQFFDRLTVSDDLLAKVLEQIQTTNKLLMSGVVTGSTIDIPDIEVMDRSIQIAKIEKLTGMLIDMGYILYQGQRYKIEYHAMPYIAYSIPAATALSQIKKITVPLGAAFWVVDFSATTEDTNGQKVEIGFNTSRGSIIGDLSLLQFGPAPLGSTGNVQFDTLARFPTIVRESESIIIKASNTHTSAILFGYTFHFIVLIKDIMG